jgi:D-alanyl-lipoteichoic acid acyltransferase DltB (MBOAT superfamily)
MLSYTLQIYFDFSGYCDMAAGIAKMFNIDLPLNFNSPYKALNISDFWKRWHMTLTRFFTKYVYIPLGGNRKGNIRTYVNMLIVFLVSGLWHGANWTFILWGAAHGFVSVLTRMTNKKKLSDKTGFPKLISWLFTFLFVNLAWVMFRADSVSEAVLFYRQIFSLKMIQLDDEFMALALTDGIKVICKFIPIIGSVILNNWLFLILMKYLYGMMDQRVERILSV